MARAFKSAALAAARAAQDKKAEKIVVLDARKTSPVVDYLVIVTALSRPHLQALEHKIEESLLAEGLRLHRRSRPQSDSWLVLDFGGLMVHIMTEQARELYGLERLHVGAKEISWRK